MKKQTFSLLAARGLQAADERISLVGFASSMRSLLTELEGDSEYIGLIWSESRPRFVPDAFLIDRKKSQVVIYEIEDTHPLTIEKLERLFAFYWWLDAHYWILRVLITNRYGEVTNEIDLFHHFFAKHRKPNRKKRADVLTKRQLISLEELELNMREQFVKRCLQENAKRLTTRRHSQHR